MLLSQTQDVEKERGGEGSTLQPQKIFSTGGEGGGKKELGRCLPGKIFAQGILYLRKTSTKGCIHFHHLFKTGQLRLSWQKVANSAPDTMASPLPPSPVKGRRKEEKDEAEGKRERGGVRRGRKREIEEEEGGGFYCFCCSLFYAVLTSVGRTFRTGGGYKSAGGAGNSRKIKKDGLKKLPFYAPKKNLESPKPARGSLPNKS